MVCLHRPGADTSYLRALGCELVSGELGDGVAAQAGRMEGCQGLVHSAAEVYGKGPLDRIRAINVESTRDVFSAAAEVGVTQGVHVSSVAVYGDRPGQMSEETPLDSKLPPRDFYARTKREAEAAARESHGRGRLGVTILRPPLLYGERDRRFTARLGRVLRNRRVTLMGSGKTLFAAVYAGNAAEAVERALGEAGSGEVFNVTEDVPVTLRAIFEGLGRELGIQPYYVTVPAWLVRRGAELGDRRGWEIPWAAGLSLSRAARLALEDNPYPTRKARETLGWSPPFSLEEALGRTGKWLREKETGNE